MFSDIGKRLPIIAGAVVVVVLAIAYFADLLPEKVIAIVIAIAFSAILAFLCLSLQIKQKAFRTGVYVYIAAFLFLALYPAKVAFNIGNPDAVGALSQSEKSLSVGDSGTYRLLVGGHIDTGTGVSSIKYRLGIGEGKSVEGTLERTYSSRRMRKGPAVSVAETHDVEMHDVKISGSPAAVSLESLTGPEITVQAFKEIPTAILWAFAALVLLAGTFLDVKASLQGNLIMIGAAAVCFGAIIHASNPASMVLPAIWGALLGAAGGALGGSALAAIGKRIFGDSDPRKHLARN